MRYNNNNNSLHKLLHCHILKQQFLSRYRQTIGRTDRTGPLGTEPVVLKSIVTVQCIDVDVNVQSIVVVGRFIELIDHWSFSVN